jgi:hypothetical protein
VQRDDLKSDSDAEISSDSGSRWSVDAQRCRLLCRHTIAGSHAAVRHTEVPVLPWRSGGLALPAVRMDNGWQAMDSAAASRPLTNGLLSHRDGCTFPGNRQENVKF